MRQDNVSTSYWGHKYLPSGAISPGLGYANVLHIRYMISVRCVLEKTSYHTNFTAKGVRNQDLNITFGVEACLCKIKL